MHQKPPEIGLAFGIQFMLQIAVPVTQKPVNSVEGKDPMGTGGAETLVPMTPEVTD